VTSENSPSKVAARRRRDQSGIGRLHRAVDDEGAARQRLEGGANRAIGVIIMRPGEREAGERKRRKPIVGPDRGAREVFSSMI
jgi:hypothetical protein